MADRIILLDPHSSLPAYEQIRMQIAAWIAAGGLAAGDLLPSVRQLADDLGIAPNTVVRAYQELEKEGWIHAYARQGYRVGDRPPAMDPGERQQRLRAMVAWIVWQGQSLGATRDEIEQEFRRQWPVVDSGGQT